MSLIPVIKKEKKSNHRRPDFMTGLLCVYGNTLFFLEVSVPKVKHFPDPCCHGCPRAEINANIVTVLCQIVFCKFFGEVNLNDGEQLG